MNTESSAPEIRTQSLDGATIQYLLWESQAPPLVLLHATGFFPWLWHPIATRLQNRFRVIAPYFCDHRACRPESGGLSWMVLAKDLVNFCAALALETPFMAGHSMGATVCTLAAALHPDLAAGLILIEPIFLPREIYQINVTVEEHPLAGKAIKRRNFWEDKAEATAYLKSKPLFRNWAPEMLDLYIQYGLAPANGGGLKLTCPPATEAALFMGGMAYDPWPVLPAVTCPALVVEGENSENRQFIDLKKAAGLFPQGRYQEVKDAGHLIPMEKPEAVASLFDFFL